VTIQENMPRRARIVVPGCAHHVTQRGNHQADVFHDDEDRYRYMDLLEEHSSKHDLLIWSYSLMTNHIHTIVVPPTNTSMAEVFRNAHSAYGRWFQKKYGLNGHLWQGRFYSCVLSESHLWRAVRYVERNPVRAGIVKRAEDYRWSSARSHVFGTRDPLLDPKMPLVGVVGNWSDWLSSEDIDSELKAIRKATAKDFPFGEGAFVENLEAELGRRLRPNKVGRRPKPKPEPGEETEQGILFAAS
jgi:putative transposase